MQRGVELLDLSADQMTNDLTKCIKAMERLRQERGLPDDFTTVAAGGWELGGQAIKGRAGSERLAGAAGAVSHAVGSNTGRAAHH